MFNEDLHNNKERLIEEVLGTPPGFVLSDNFADKIVARVTRDFAWQQYIREFLIYFGTIAGIAILLAATAFLWMGANPKNWLQFLIDNGTIVSASVFLLIFVLFADRVLLRYMIFRQSSRFDSLH